MVCCTVWLEYDYLGPVLFKMYVTDCYTGCVCLPGFISRETKPFDLTMTNWPISSDEGHLNVA